MGNHNVQNVKLIINLKMDYVRIQIKMYVKMVNINLIMDVWIV